MAYAIRALTTSPTTGKPLPAGTYEVGAYALTAPDMLIGPADGPVPNVTAPLVLR